MMLILLRFLEDRFVPRLVENTEDSAGILNLHFKELNIIQLSN